MDNIPDKSIDCIIADIPYGETECEWDTIIDLEKLWISYKKIIILIIYIIYFCFFKIKKY